MNDFCSKKNRAGPGLKVISFVAVHSAVALSAVINTAQVFRQCGYVLALKLGMGHKNIIRHKHLLINLPLLQHVR